MLGQQGSNYVTVDGTFFPFGADRKAASRKATAHEKASRQAAEEKAGRAITDKEWIFQGLEPATDSRSHNQKYADANFSVKVRSELSPTEKLLQEAQSAVVAKQNHSLSKEEALVHALENMVDEEHGIAAAKQEHKAFLKSVAPKLQVIEQLIESERWNPESDQGFRVRLDQAKETILDAQADASVLPNMFKAIDSVLIDRRELKATSLLQQREELAIKVRANDESLQSLQLLSDPEPKPQEEHAPNPHGYENPFPNAPSEPDPIPTPPILIDKTKNLSEQGHQLWNAVKGSDLGDRVYDANRSRDAGDSAPLTAILDFYESSEAASEVSE